MTIQEVVDKIVIFLSEKGDDANLKEILVKITEDREYKIYFIKGILNHLSELLPKRTENGKSDNNY